MNINDIQQAIDGHKMTIENLNKEIKILDEKLTILRAEETSQSRIDGRNAAVAAGRAWREANPEEHAKFMADIKKRNEQSLIDGEKMGWWDLDDNGDMLAPPIIINSSELPDNALMAHVMAKANIFPSIGQARKNGWDKPLELGTFIVTKKKIRIKVV